MTACRNSGKNGPTIPTPLISRLDPATYSRFSVPDVEELKSQTERVSPEGTINLPIAGEVHVAGLNEEQARAAIQKQLSVQVKDPRVEMFVKEFSSRQVAIMGMVAKPGLYTVNGHSDTLLDIVGRAGGMTGDAGGAIIFIPTSGLASSALLASKLMAQDDKSKSSALTASNGRSAAIGAQQAEQNGPEQPAPKLTAGAPMIPGALAGNSAPIFISVNDERALDLPARPGDVLIVPARGEVLVQGWVPNPGAYQITPGMSSFGAVTAAGGQLYSSSVSVLRSGPGGTKIDIPVDLSKVKSGLEPDVPVQSGDVVIVNRSAAGAIPYSLYFLISHFSSGMALPLAF